MIYTLTWTKNNSFKIKVEKKGLNKKMKDLNKWNKTYHRNLTFLMKINNIVKSN